MSLVAKCLSATAVAHARASTAMHRALAAGDAFVAGVLDASLADDEKSRLGVRLYDAAPHYRDPGQLFEWERVWFDKRLPKAPASVLVTACGAGREVIALTDMGYQVTAFEPAPSLLALAVQRVPAARFSRASYREWIERKETARYDAIVLGWGSLAHVLGASERAALLSAAHRACPTGPILASYWPAPQTRPGQARATGQRVGRAISAVRGVATSPTGDAWTANIGFAHGFSDAELRALADSVGRTLAIDGKPGDYPHAAFLHRSA